jgi:hypothetical protein
MDLQEAIKAHSDWKMKLRKYLVKPDKSLGTSEVGAADKCQLGKWLMGEGRKHAHLPVYSVVVSQHTAFHKAAASVVANADRGLCVDGDIALGSKSPFAEASRNIVSALMKLQADL